MFSDIFLLDTFTLPIDGYEDKDRDFDYKYIDSKIHILLENKRQIQLEVADKLIFANPAISTNILKDNKITIVGQDAGAVCGLYFLAQNSTFCSNLIVLDCGVRFDSLSYKWRLFQTQRLLGKSIESLQKNYQKTINIAQKNFLGNLIHNSTHKGIRSYIKILSKYDFGIFFERLQISDQKNFANTSILAVGTNKNNLATKSSILKIPKYINPAKQFIHKKHTIINTINSQSKFQSVFLYNSYNSFGSDHHAERLATLIGNFLT
jgi:hypothetical protein